MAGPPVTFLVMAKRRPLPFDPVEEAARQWSNHFGADAAVQPMRAVTSLMRVQQIVLSRLDEILRRYALPLGKMGERLQIHPTSVTSIVRRLERDGLVRRLPHPEDGRGVLAEVTEEGRAVVAATTKELVAIRFGLDPLDDESLATVHELLTRIRHSAGDFI